MVVAPRVAPQAKLHPTIWSLRRHRIGGRLSFRMKGRPAMNILVIQHCPLTPVGLVGATAESMGAQLTIVLPHHGDPFPADPDRFDGLILCGGPMHAGNDAEFPAFPPMLRL